MQFQYSKVIDMNLNHDSINEKLLEKSQLVLPAWLPTGEFGSEGFTATFSFGEGIRKFVINTDNGGWKDFATGRNGAGFISLYAYLNNQTPTIAADKLNYQLSNTGFKATQAIQLPEKFSRDRHVIPAPCEPKKTDFNIKTPDAFGFEKINRPLTTYAYQNSDDETMGYTALFDVNGALRMLQFSYIEKGGEEKSGWFQVDFCRPRPLYGLQFLNLYPDAIIMFFTNERNCDDFNALSNKKEMFAMSWAGGIDSQRDIDYSPLINKKIIFWPEKTEQGFNVMDKFYKKLKMLCPALKFILPPMSEENGWSCSDFVGNLSIGTEKASKELAAFIHSRVGNYKSFLEMESTLFSEPEGIYEDYDDIVPAHYSDEPTIDQIDQSHLPDLRDNRAELGYIDPNINMPFLCLGYNRDSYFYFPANKKQVIEVSSTQHAGAKMLSLGPLSYWEQAFPKGGKSRGVDWAEAANFMFRYQEKLGVYNPDNQRGFGCWMDEGRVVYHLGNKLYADGKLYGLNEFKSRYIYELSFHTEEFVDNPLSNSEAAILMDEVMDRLYFSQNISKYYLSGWIVCAQICGALDWRPHIQITGPAGSGKTTIFNDIIEPILGHNLISVESSTTSAALSGLLQSDTLPIKFDEFEGKGRINRKQVDGVFEFLRQASSESNSVIAKGTPGGKAILYRGRTCAALSGITVNMQGRADLDRITIIRLNNIRSAKGEAKKKIDDSYAKMQQVMAETFTKEWGARFRSRIISLIPTIRANVKTFKKAVAAYRGMGDQRMGDQLGTLLAGSYAIKSSNEISLEDAIKWVEAQDFTEHMEMAEQSDEAELLDIILMSVINHRNERRSIREVYNALLNNDLGDDFEGGTDRVKSERRELRLTLARHGLNYNENDNNLIIACKHPELSRVLEMTSISANWGEVLERIEGVTKERSVKFYDGSRRKSIVIPHKMLVDNES